MSRAIPHPTSRTTLRSRALGTVRRARLIIVPTVVLTSVALTSVALTAPAGAAPADEGAAAASAEAGAGASVTWTISPATAEGPDPRVSLRHGIDPGTAATDHVAVTNFSPQAVTFDVYASDGTVTEDGAFDLVPPGEPQTDGSGSWIEIGAIENAAPRDGGGITLEIAPESTVVLPVTITVPGEATPGDHPAGIVAELAQSPDGEVQMVSRVGVRAHLRVTGDLAPTLEPVVDEIRWSPSWNPFAAGTLTVTYTVANTGNVRLGSGETVEQAGVLGTGRSSVAETHDEILPRQSVVTTVAPRTWPTFRTTGTLTVVPTTVGADEIPGDLPQAQVTYSAWTLPWSQLAAIVLLVGGLLLRRRVRRRRDLAVEARIKEAVEAATSTSSDRDEERARG
ncbi:hypothetical protein C8046_15365 [Serinibacter arcticus]|uniref:DUF916 domain-containing protein n=1 Tax=Serinibacter arcticus TaxID=1655435 RepID=A0A2U1ZXW1_9MICO|nr:hypothetical protein [Serinibacter arcticus]PWD51819.1 hypothetical protein C8046_15365 [Serinibacter arcticus]